MTDMEILKAMISAGASGTADFAKKEDWLVTLKEKTAQPPYEITIEGLPDACFILKADYGRCEATFNKAKGARRRADYIIITDDGQSKRILYIELKKSNNQKKNKNASKESKIYAYKEVMQEVSEQLKGAKCLIEYCRAIGNVFWEDEGGGKFLQQYNEHYILIKCLEVPDKMLVATSLADSRMVDKHSSPDNPKILNVYKNLEYNELVA